MEMRSEAKSSTIAPEQLSSLKHQLEIVWVARVNILLPRGYTSLQHVSMSGSVPNQLAQYQMR